MQRSRRSNPYPLTWEIPVGIILAVLLLLVLGVHAGRAVANLVAGSGLTMTPRAELLTSLPGLLSGNSAAGLDPSPVPVAGAGLLWACIAFVEVVITTLLAWAGRHAWSSWGPGRVDGVASRAELDQVLGLGRLRKVAPVVRPDLYGKAKS